MSVARGMASAVTLTSGKVLVVGGTSDGTGATSSTELYDPPANSWSSAPSMTTPRSDFPLPRLNDGRVLAIGGTSGTSALSSSEVFNPTSDTWVHTGDLFVARYGEMAALLNDGRVLVAGGLGDQGALASAEIFDPQQNAWSLAAPMSSARVGATMTVLNDGLVLVTGGSDGTSVLRTSEIFDPAANAWTNAGQLNAARSFASAQRLQDGRVLVAGGFDSEGTALGSSELFQPSTSAWSLTGSRAHGRGGAASALLPDGRVLVAGGLTTSGSPPTALADAEIFDPFSTSWSTAGAMSSPRASAASAQLSDGRVLVAGGIDGATYLNTSDIYTPEQAPATAADTDTPTVTDTPQADTPTPGGDTPTPTATEAQPTDTPTATSESPVFRILAVRVEPNTGKPDWQHKQAVLKTVPSGQTLQLSSYTEFDTLPPAAHVAVWSRVTLNGGIVHRAGLTAHLSPDDAGDLWQHTSFRPTLPGQYTVTVTVSIDATTHRSSSTFTVTSPPAPKLSFSFNSLHIVDARGRPLKTVSRGQRVFVRADWTTVGSPATINVQLGETLEIRSGSGWRALGGPLRTTFDTPLGRHTFAFSFVPGGTYASLRVVIDLTIAGRTAERAAVISLRA
jgi:N-acetylneuraminic acid mutarotase